MSKDSYTLEVLAETNKYAQAMAQIPGITDKQVAKAALGFQKSWMRAQEQASKAATKAAGAAGGAWDELADRADAAGGAAARLRGVLDQLNPAAGAAAGLVNDLGDAVTVLASPAGAAVAGVAALALGAAALAAGMVKAAFATDEALERLEGLRRVGSDVYPAVSEDTLNSIERLNTSTTALGSIWDAITVALGAEVAPALERVASVAVGLGLALLDVVKATLDGVDAVKVFGGAAVAEFLRPLDAVAQLGAGVLGVMVQLGDAAAELATSMGVEVPAGVDDALNRMDALRVTLEEGSSGLVDYIGESLNLGDVIGDLEGRGRAFIETQLRANEAMKAGAEEVAKMTSAYREGLAAMDEDTRLSAQVLSLRQQLQAVTAGNAAAYHTEAEALAAAQQAELASLLATYQQGIAASAANSDERLKLTEDYEAAVVAVKDRYRRAEADADRAALERRADEQRKFADVTVTSFDQSLSAVSDLVGIAAEAQAERTGKAAVGLFRFQQGVAMVQSGINGAVAVTKALADLGPVAGAVAAIGIGLTTAAQIAAIAAQEPPAPPSFAVGGIATVSGGGGLHAPDDDVSLTRRELFGVLNPRGIREAGGPAGVRDLNRGRSQASPVIIAELGGRLEDRGVALRRARAGVLQRALDDGQTLGKARRTGRS